MEKKIKRILDDIGLDKKYRGYYYWIALIERAYKLKGFSLGDLTITDYYYMTAKQLHTTGARIERNLRTTIADKKNVISEYFNYYNKITNKVFLILVLDKIKFE